MERTCPQCKAVLPAETLACPKCECELGAMPATPTAIDMSEIVPSSPPEFGPMVLAKMCAIFIGVLAVIAMGVVATSKERWPQIAAVSLIVIGVLIWSLAKIGDLLYSIDRRLSQEFDRDESED